MSSQDCGSAWKDTHGPCGLSPFALRPSATTGRSPARRAGAERQEPVSSPAAAMDRDPAFVYLARLAPGSRRTMAQALRTIIEIG
ncbi:MAG: hypothetical protein ACW99U_21395, partial [Candidatus Thorarchaeota archaeon]